MPIFPEMLSSTYNSDMLTRIQIEDFRVCKHVELDTARTVTVLSGPNASGKTSILQAVRRAAAFACGHFGRFDAVLRPAFARKTSLDVRVDGIGAIRYTLDLSEEQDRVLLESLSEVGRDGSVNELFVRSNETVKCVQSGLAFPVAGTFPVLPALAALFPDSQHATSIANGLRHVFRFVRLYSADATALREGESGIDNHSFDEDAEERMTFADRESQAEWRHANRSPNELPWDSTVRELYEISENDPDSLQEIESLLGPNGLDIIDGIHVSTSLRANGEPQPDLRFGPAGWGRPTDHGGLNFRELAYGIRRVIQIVVSLLYKRGSVLLWDQPEDGIDPRLLRKTVSLMRTYSEGGQLLVATHSTEILDATRADEVILVSLVNGETHARALSSEESQWAKHYLNEVGPFSDFLETLQEA